MRYCDQLTTKETRVFKGDAAALTATFAWDIDRFQRFGVCFTAGAMLGVVKRGNMTSSTGQSKVELKDSQSLIRFDVGVGVRIL